MMPRQGKTLVSINVTPEELERVNRLAQARGFKFTSDYLRHLIEADAEALGKPLKFTVKRGGYRPRMDEA